VCATISGKVGYHRLDYLLESKDKEERGEKRIQDIYKSTIIYILWLYNPRTITCFRFYYCY